MRDTLLVTVRPNFTKPASFFISVCLCCLLGVHFDHQDMYEYLEESDMIPPKLQSQCSSSQENQLQRHTLIIVSCKDARHCQAIT
jgi:hypothetical protein